MKVAFLTTDSREHFKDYGKELPYFGSAPAALLEGFNILGAPQIHVISCTQKIMRSSSRLAQNIWFHSLHVPKWGWLRTGYLGCVLATRRLLRQIRPDIVHGQGTERDCAISAVFSGFRNVLTIHGNMAELARLFSAKPMSFHWIAAKLENLALSRSSGIFCNSLYTKELVEKRSRKTWLVPNPLALAFFEEPTQINSGDSSIPTFLVIALVCPRKRQQELLKMFLRLKGLGKKFRVRWIGHCPKDSYGLAFLEMLRSEDFSAWNTFVGPLEQRALIQELDSASALVHFPSEESFGLVVAEALARNLKVFAAKTGGLQDICAGPTDAICIPPDDWAGLIRALDLWLHKTCPRPQGPAQVMVNRYHPLVIAARHLEIYRELTRLV